MKVLYWNVRGFANQKKRSLLRQICRDHKHDFLFISEPWIVIDQVSAHFWSCLNLKSFVTNNRDPYLPNLWGFCASHLDPIVFSASKQQVTSSFIWNGQTYFLFAVYASTNHVIRRSLWQDLASLTQTNPGPWLVVGDFNSILGAHSFGNLL